MKSKYGKKTCYQCLTHGKPMKSHIWTESKLVRSKGLTGGESLLYECSVPRSQKMVSSKHWHFLGQRNVIFLQRPTSTCDELSWRGALPNSFILSFKVNQLKYVSPIYYRKSNDGLFFGRKNDSLKVNKIEHFGENQP